MFAATLATVLLPLTMLTGAVAQGFNCKAEGFCTTSDPNCNFCLNIEPAAKIKVCQAIDPTYKTAPGDISRGPPGADFQCIVTCCH
ncbi:EC34 protein [Colletotrichum truncatum]|uniref:EC34 protein n=1 Tax=Colletotrichum truncatum TaxID=5467 RepID=A0ACC3YW92_COLTU|nr:EC34 protein [Colletotrichum truncatum]KAF6787392.1 EC34 protein [Colletotrichum truncatum]